MNQLTNQVNMTRVERGVHLAGGAALLLVAARGRSGWARLALLATAGTLIYQGISGRGPFYRLMNIRAAGGGSRRIKVEHSVSVHRRPEEVYAFWRNFENLPRFMRHLESVRVIDDRRSQWSAKSPFGGTVDWEAEVTRDLPDQEIGWRSLPGAQVDNAGVVRFLPALNGHGCVIQVEMKYVPPAGKLGAAIAKLLGEEPQVQIEEDLERLRDLLQTGAATGGVGKSRAASQGAH